MAIVSWGLSLVLLGFMLALLLKRRRWFVLASLTLGPVTLSGLAGLGRVFSDSESSLGGFSVDGIRLIVLVFVVGILLTVFSRFRNQVERTPLFVVFILGISISTFWSIWPVEGLRIVLKLLYPLMIMWLVMGSTLTIQHARQLLWAIVAAVAINIGIGILSLATGQGSQLGYDGSMRYGTLLLHPGAVAAFLGISMLVVAAVYIRTRRKLLLGLVVLGVVQLFLTGARMGWLVFVCGGMIVALLSPSTKLRLFVFVTVLVAIAGVFLDPNLRLRFFGPYELDEWFAIVQNDPASLLTLVNTSGRDTLYSTAWQELFLPSPVWGSGAGSGQAAMIYFGYLDGIHSEHLRLLIDVGVVGWSLYLLALASLGFDVFRVRRRIDKEGKMLCAVAIAGLVQYILFMITDNGIDYYAVYAQYIFALAGLALIWPRFLRLREPSQRAQATISSPAELEPQVILSS